MMTTDKLIRDMSTPSYGVHDRRQVSALRSALLFEASRPPEQSLLDPNFQDSDGKTIIMHIIDLGAKLMGYNRLRYMAGTQTGLKRMLARTDLRLKNNKGEAPLNYLAKKIQQVDSKEDLIWWLATKLVDLASAADMLNSRDAFGQTPFLRWCQTVNAPHVLQLLIAAGCDVTAADEDGNNGIHHLASRYEEMTLEVLITATPRSFVVHPWCVPNHAGLTPLNLVRGNLLRLLVPASKVWPAAVAPLVFEQISIVLHGCKDVARLCLEYLDGSGRPFGRAVDDEDFAVKVED